MTEEQLKDKASVWTRMAQEHPEFIREYDPTQNYHTVREIVLGGSITWGETNRRFQPRPGTHVMDIGANVGIYSAFCAANGAFVSSYECDPSCVAIIQKMIADTGIAINLSPVAVHTYTGTVEFEGHSKWDSGDECEWHNGGLFVPGIRKMVDDKVVNVPCISFEEAVGSTVWDMVKMDIEGGEAEILTQVPESVLRQIKFMYVELHPWTPQELHDQVIERMKLVFKFDGYWSEQLNRWEALYLEAK